MGILTDDMRRVLDEQQLGFIATVTPDGKPNLSPKGTTTAWDDDHLVFADIRSPATIANLRANPAMEINVVDTTLRKGYRFKGAAEVLSEGALFDDIVAFYRRRGSTSPFRHIVLMKIERAAPLTSPAYDSGRSEADVAAQWDRHWDELRKKRSGT
jgi:predicted pyridoxine 5'-phosphate oxidase superfamily flavin-nucleotide-binding protein